MAEPSSSPGIGDRARGAFEESRTRHFVVRHNGNVAVDIPLWLFIVFIIFGMPAAVIGIVVAVIAGAELQFTPPTRALEEEPAPEASEEGRPPAELPDQD